MTLANTPAARADDMPDPEATDFVREFDGLSDRESERKLLHLVCRHAAAVLRYDEADTLEPDVPFSELGFDSLTGVELRNRLSAATGLKLAVALVFDHPKPRALAAHLRQRLLDPAARAAVVRRSRVRTDEPVAIVGMACRYPGAVTSPEDLWRLVDQGEDAISGFPADRGWSAVTADSSYAGVGGFLHDVAEFDAEFFGVSPREALAMDPQQRLLLQVSWEAVERAGINPHSLAGSRTGVFAGAGGQDYVMLMASSATDADRFGLTGNSASVISGRVSYAFGFEGPTLTVDTACSSSLVAIHLAAQALRHDECSLALAGGVTVMSTPGMFTEFSRQGGLAADGRCKAFAEEADGTGWAEGVGVLVLERLSDARRNGHRVLAVVRGSAVNSDGASNGLTAPNGPSQERVILEALAAAGLEPSDVDAVEAHGTGTALGDPIEAGALLATCGRGRDPERPLWLGSVKSNIGHTQAAAGVAGVIKMVQAMRHETLPRTLHAEHPTSHVDWSSGAVALLDRPVPWKENGHPRRAGVSSFGIGGTNAHVVLEQPPTETAEPVGTPEPVAAAGVEDGPTAWLVSGRGPAGLRAQAAHLADFAESAPEVSPTDVAFSLVTTRAQLTDRAAVVGTGRDELVRGLRALAAGTPGAGVHTDTATDGVLAVLFTGQGSQWPGMGRSLYGVLPDFTDILDRIFALLDGRLDRPLREVLFAEPGSADAALLDETVFTQAGLFAVEVALFGQLRAWGVAPDYVAGHSIGEVSAACVAGVLELDDACRLVAARGRAMQRARSDGAMLAVGAAEEAVAPLLTPGISLAAVNGPDSVVVSGDADTVAAIERESREQGWKTKRLHVSRAFHSPHMDAVLEEFTADIADIAFHAPRIPIVSNLTGGAADERIGTPRYWADHIRATVRFGDGVSWLVEQGVTAFLEVGPDAVLTAMAADRGPRAVPTLRAGRDEQTALVTGLSRLHVHGVDVDWSAVFARWQPHRVELPTYAFQATRYWPEPRTARPSETDDSTAGTAFWASVESGDADHLADVLGMDTDRARAALDIVAPALADWRSRDRIGSTVAGLRYRVDWRAAPVDPAVASGTWLLLGVDGAAAVFGESVTVEPTEDSAALTERLRSAASGRALGGLLAAVPDAQAALAVVQAAAAAELGVPVWLLTRNAVPAGAGEVCEPDQAAVWGMGRVASLELPGSWGGVVDLPDEADAGMWALAGGALASGAEDQVAVRATGVFVPRLVPCGRATEAGRGWRPRGTVLVTGGTGALGTRVARWLAARGARRLVLASRSGPDAPGVDEVVAELAATGAVVDVVACDVTDLDAVRQLVSDETISAVVHTAGVDEPTPLQELGPARLDAVMAAKVRGAANLDVALGGRSLDAFVLFSSVAGVWGSGGQGAYGAANAWLDGLAWARWSRGLAATSVAWGAWDSTGIGSGSHAKEFLARRGIRAIDPEVAIAALQRALDLDETAVVVADVDWETFIPGYASARPRPLLDELAPTTDDTAADGEGTELAGRLAGLPPDERNRVLLDLVRDGTAQVLGAASADAVRPERPFSELGFDSISAVELRNLLDRATGLRLSATLVFDRPTPVAVAEHLDEQLAGTADQTAETVLAELDRLESALAEMSPADRLVRRIDTRLESVLAKWRAATHQVPQETSRVDVGEASAEEIFNYIDDELGLG
ncbi:type I polyketide synthase [Streptomyces antioxidans]|uniref:Type I polyketide synthase n=1 Tax=Streptomyces antioxidans TaxID=1507734 RepID=A0A1V4CW49_9ACTN|nr:type I polyketide synthase [Streptomyces antioxidans]OPF71921.1 type I polyketide synthase [Streptomyces antioxidans]